MKRLSLIVALAAGAALALVAGSAFAGTKTSVIYDSSAKSGPPSNLPSAGPEAYGFQTMFEKIDFTAGSPRKLTNAVLTLSSWACVSGTWYSGDCSTPTGATFARPITLTVENADATQVLATATQTFNIPYRPSASPVCGDGRWYSGGAKTCFNGLANDVTFNFNGNVTLPNSVVYIISYNSTHYGPSPIGEGASCYGTTAGCPYDSLNIALNDTGPGSILGTPYYWGVFPGYTPAVQFKAGGGS